MSERYTSEYLARIKMYADGIIRDKNEMDKVYLQATSIPFLVERIELDFAELRQQLEMLQKAYETLDGMFAMSDYLRESALSLSEERRVALSKCNFLAEGENDFSQYCRFCGNRFTQLLNTHEPDCDYVRLCELD